MVNSVEDYLSELRKELTGCDPSTVQDALSDSEEHLRMALRTDSNLESIIEKYGTPPEVAAGYKELEKYTPPPLSPLVSNSKNDHSIVSSFFGVFAEIRVWAALFYFLLTLGTGIIYFTWVVTGLSLSIGLIILIIGLPVLVVFLLSVRGMAFIEGRIVEALLGIRMPRRPRYTEAKFGWLERIRRLFTDRTTWTSMIYMVFLMPFGIFYFTLFISLIGLSLELVLAPFAELLLDQAAFEIGDKDYHLSVWLMPFVIVAGILLLTLTLHLVKLFGFVHGRVAKVLLVSN